MKQVTANQEEIPEEVKISNTPADIDLSNLKIEAHDCFINSYRVAEKYPEVKIIEGFMVATFTDGHRPKGMNHVWNCIHTIHFDVTKNVVWDVAEQKDQLDKIRYYPTCISEASDYSYGDLFEFDEVTKFQTDCVNQYIDNNQKGI